MTLFSQWAPWFNSGLHIALIVGVVLFISYCLSLDFFLRLAFFVGRLCWKALQRAIWFARHTRVYRKRVPLRSTKRDAKRAAHAYAKQLTGRNISWKKARRLLNRLEREGKAQGYTMGNGVTP